MTNCSNFNIVVASSLGLKAERKAIMALADELNESKEETHISFSVFEYEEDKRFQQIYGPNAQLPVEKAVAQSPFFVLICDGVIGDKSVEEFRRACSRFEQHKFPAYIYVFYKDYSQLPGVAVPQPRENQRSFEQFVSDMRSLHFNEEGKVESVDRIYPIPYTDVDSLKAELREELQDTFMQHAHLRPLLDAKRGCELTAEDFYGDQERQSHCKPGLYFERGFDKRLIEAMDEKKYVYLYGMSLSGKTRAVIHAAHKNPDMWFYLFPSNCAAKVKAQKLQDIEQYIRTFQTNQSQCIIFDDFDASYETEEFDALINTINRHNNNAPGLGRCVVVFTSSSASYVPDEADNQSLETIMIGDMTEQEVVNASRYFQGHGENVGRANKTYRTTGALLINLDEIKNAYRRYVENSEDGSHILYAIKALSLWDKQNVGNLELIKQFYKGEPIDFKNDIKELCKQCKGIFRLSGRANALMVEEYVYRYIIGWDGDVLPDGAEDNDVESLLRAVDKLMAHSFSHESEHLLVTAGKLVKQSGVFGREVVRHLYTICTGTASDCQEAWKQRLAQIWQQDDLDNEDVRTAYSRIVRFLIFASTDFDDMLALYKQARYKDVLMVSALYKQAGENEKREEALQSVEMLDSYKDTKDSVWIKLRRSQMEDTFETAYRWVADCVLPKTLEGKKLADDGLRPFFNKTMQRLLSLVSCREEFDQLVVCLRANAHVLPLDTGKTIVPDNLTYVELLSSFPTYPLRCCITSLLSTYEGSYESFVRDFLVEKVKCACENDMISMQSIRALGERVAGLIMCAIPDDVPYSVLFNEVFLPLEFTYQKAGVQYTMKLRNTYVYLYMMKRKDCTYWDSAVLMNDFFSHQCRDKENFILPNRYVLNPFVELSGKVRSSLIQRNAFRLFDTYAVEPDVRSYNMMMMHAQSFEEGLNYLRQMNDAAMTPDNYTLTSLLESVKDLSTLVAHLSVPPQCTERLLLPEILGGDGELRDALTDKLRKERLQKEVDIREVISEQEYAWDLFFKLRAKDQDEADMKWKVLNYLENTESMHWVLAKSTIYSYCLEDKKMVVHKVDVQKLWKSIREKRITNIDGYLYNGLIAAYRRIHAESMYGDLVELYKDIYRDLKDNEESMMRCLNSRLDFFKTYRGKTWCILPGEEKPVMRSALEYVQALVDSGFILNENTVYRFMQINKSSKEIGTDKNCTEQYAALIRLVEDHNVELSLEVTDRLLRLYEKYCEDEEKDTDEELLKFLNDRLERFDAVTQNKYKVHLFVSNKFDKKYLAAAQRIDRGNITSATIAYNNILSAYIAKCAADGDRNEPAFFDYQIRPFYEEFYQGAIKPTAETIAILASSVNSMEQLHTVLGWANTYNLSLTPHCFTNALRGYVSSYEDVKAIYSLYKDAGGSVDIKQLSVLTTAMGYRAVAGDKTAQELYVALVRYYFPEKNYTNEEKIRCADEVRKYAPDFDVLNRIGEDYMELYLVYSVLKVYRRTGYRMGTMESVLNRVCEAYPALCERQVDGQGLLDWLVNKGYLSDNEQILSWYRSFGKANPNTFVTNELIEKMLKGVDTVQDYTCLMEAFGYTKPENFFCYVPLLCEKLYQLRLNGLDAVWGRVLCYAPLHTLRYGHFMPDGAASTFDNSWENTPLHDSYNIYRHIQQNVMKNPLPAVAIVQQYAVNLDDHDAYYVALWFLTHEHGDSKIGWTKFENGARVKSKLGENVSACERRYIDAYREKQISQRTLLQFPLYWAKINYFPSSEMVLLVVRNLKKISQVEGVASVSAKMIISGLRKTFFYQKNENDTRPEKFVKCPLTLLNKDVESNLCVYVHRAELRNILFEKPRQEGDSPAVKEKNAGKKRFLPKRFGQSKKK